MCARVFGCACVVFPFPFNKIDTALYITAKEKYIHAHMHRGIGKIREATD